MSPIVTAVLALLPKLIEEAPEVIEHIKVLLNKKEATVDDWNALRLKIEVDSFEKVAPNSAAQLAAEH
jgi:hypothetical protein